MVKEPVFAAVIVPATGVVDLTRIPTLLPPLTGRPDLVAAQLMRGMVVPHLLRRQWILDPAEPHDDEEDEPDDYSEEWDTDLPDLCGELPPGLSPRKLIRKSYRYGVKH